jgi:hypothetical protein
MSRSSLEVSVLRGLALSFAWMLAVGCASPTESADASSKLPSAQGTAAREPRAEAPSNATANKPAGGLEGTWSSPSCGERRYERVVTLQRGRFEASDRVSPCPAGARCAWAGIVPREGTYEAVGAVVRLVLQADEKPASAGAAFPGELSFVDGVLSEQAPDGSRCAYTRR